MIPSEWVAAARARWRTRGSSGYPRGGGKTAKWAPPAPPIVSVAEARALQLYYAVAVRRPTLGDVMILLEQLEDLLYERWQGQDVRLDQRLAEARMRALRAELERDDLQVRLKQARAIADGAKSQALKLIAENLTLQAALALRQRPSAAPDGRAATLITRRRAEALLNHLAAGGNEGANARLRLLESLCGERP
jgi:hypothetical protein